MEQPHELKQDTMKRLQELGQLYFNGEVSVEEVLKIVAESFD